VVCPHDGAQRRDRYRAALQGHTDSVIDLAFTPDSSSLLSSGDSTLRVWDIASARCMRVLQGNATALFDVDWSPDGTQLVSGGSDKLVTISAVPGGMPPRMLRGHQGLVFGVAWSPDGQRLASSSWDTTIRLWDPIAGVDAQVLRAPDPITFFCGVAWSPDGQRLASATYLNLQGVLVGMPLAIELAAAGVRLLPLDEIERQLGAHLDVLATTFRDMPARHRSMRAVFDHSWRLLSERERALFSHVAVFRGGWTADAVAQVTGAMLPALTALIDKSLVQQEGSAAPPSSADRAVPNAGDEPRYAMLEPIREYALAQLAARGEAEALGRAHASYYLGPADAAATHWDSPNASHDSPILHCSARSSMISRARPW